MEQTWTLGREHWARASVRSEKNASTEGRLRDVGSARNSVAESVAFAMASSGVAMLAITRRSRCSKVYVNKMLKDKVGCIVEAMVESLSACG